MKFEIKNRLSGAVIFSVEADSWRLAVELAIKAKTDLSYANLSSADLRSADLSSANLRYADLSSANLRYADLRYADLRSADLSYADLSSADLRSANLMTFQFQRHVAYFTFDGNIRIGCHNKPIKEWLENYKKIGEENGYDKLQVILYGKFIKTCAKLQKHHDKKKEAPWVWKFLSRVIS